MAWCEVNDVDYVLGLPGNTVLSRLVEAAADDVRVRRAEAVGVSITAAPASSLSAMLWHVRRPAYARQHAGRRLRPRAGVPAPSVTTLRKAVLRVHALYICFPPFHLSVREVWLHFQGGALACGRRAPQGGQGQPIANAGLACEAVCQGRGAEAIVLARGL
jgi:hypothetical protein